MKYRSKPVVIEAVQWDPLMPPKDLPDWLWTPLSMNPEWFDESTGTIQMFAREGKMMAQPGDWIIRGVEGELSSCKPSVFAAKYEEIKP